MSTYKKPKRKYVIRGFDPYDTFDTSTQVIKNYNCLGLLKDLPIFNEEASDHLQSTTIMKMMKPPFSNMLPTSMINSKKIIPSLWKDVTVTKIDSEFSVNDIVIVTSINDQYHIKALKDQFKEVFQTWVEKSRVVGKRGWRLSAIQEPKFEKNVDGNYEIRTQIILGHGIFYNQTSAKVLNSSNLASYKFFCIDDYSHLTSFIKNKVTRNLQSIKITNSLLEDAYVSK